MNMRRTSRSLILMSLLLAGAAMHAQAQPACTVSLAWQGTPVHVTVWAKSDDDCKAVLGLCTAELSRIEQRYASYRQGSEVNRINQYAGSEPVTLDDETLALLRWAGSLHELSEGAFDLTGAAYLWQYGFGQGDYRVPNDLRLAQVQPLVNFHYVDIDAKDKKLLFRRQGMQIEMDSIMVNHAFARLRGLLKKNGRQSAVRLSIGKNVLVWGKPPEGGAWRIPLPGPTGKTTIAVLEAEAGSLLVADIYINAFEEEGRRFHRYVDSRTGRPETERQAVYLWRGGKIKQDIPAAVLMLMPTEKGLALVDRLPETECIILGNDNTVRRSQGWKSLNVKFP